MDAKLVVAKGKTAVREIPLAGISTIIGRRNDCSLRIPSPLVSRQHCELTQAGTRLMVKDLGSSNGTFVNGAKIKQKELKSGDTLGVGPITFIVQLGGASVSPADTARPHAGTAIVDAADDVADFVVAEDVAIDDAADFVAAEEVPAEEVVDAADFVVGEEVPSEAAEEVADFVVADAAIPETDGTEVADFVASEETTDTNDADFVVSEDAGADDAEFVVAEAAIPEGETVHDVNIGDFIAEDQASELAAAEAIVEAEVVDEAEDVPAASPDAKDRKKKGGLFGRLFKRKEKQASPVQPAVAPPKDKLAGPQPPTVTPPTPDTAPPTSPEGEMPEFFVQDEPTQAANTKPVGEDEMADFLMGLNEKEE